MMPSNVKLLLCFLLICIIFSQTFCLKDVELEKMKIISSEERPTNDKPSQFSLGLGDLQFGKTDRIFNSILFVSPNIGSVNRQSPNIQDRSKRALNELSQINKLRNSRLKTLLPSKQGTKRNVQSSAVSQTSSGNSNAQTSDVHQTGAGGSVQESDIGQTSIGNNNAQNSAIQQEGSGFADAHQTVNGDFNKQKSNLHTYTIQAQALPISNSKGRLSRSKASNIKTHSKVSKEHKSAAHKASSVAVDVKASNVVNGHSISSVYVAQRGPKALSAHVRQYSGGGSPGFNFNRGFSKEKNVKRCRTSGGTFYRRLFREC